MRFDLAAGGGEWFTFFTSEIKEDGQIVYNKPENDAAQVCLRVADEETIDKIRGTTRTIKKEFVYNPKTRAMERVVYEEQTPEQSREERRLTWDHAIVAWKGILDLEGNEIPCTVDNKMKLMGNPQFLRFVGRCLQLISGAAQDAEKAAEKN